MNGYAIGRLLCILKRKLNVYGCQILLAMSFLFCISCHTSDSAATDRDIKNIPSFTQPIVVHCVCAVKQTFNYHIQSNGIIIAAFRQKVFARSSGLILSCAATDGARFAKGQLILQLDTTSLALGIVRAEAARFNAQSEYESRLLGYENLLKDKTFEEASRIKKKLQAETGLLQADVDLQQARRDLQQTIVYAPVSGRVSDVKVKAGMWVQPGDELFTIYSDKDILLKIKVTESDIGKIKIGEQASVVPLADTTHRYRAVVAYINPLVDDNGLVDVQLKLSRSEGLFPGMHASAIIEIPMKEAVMVPREAIVTRSGGKSVVFTFENGLAKWHYVTTGLNNGDETIIKDGIAAGDTVIISNNLQLSHDAPVTIEDWPAAP